MKAPLLPFSDEVRVMLAPLAAYRQLVERPGRGGIRALFGRPAAVAALLGCGMSLTTTGELIPGLVISATLCWSFVPALQMLIAAPLIVVARRRQIFMAGGSCAAPRTPGGVVAEISLSSTLDLFFVGNGPWSWWLLAVAACATAKLPYGYSNLGLLAFSAAVPLVWTWVITFGFCRVVLGLDARASIVWTALYEAAIWSVAFLYVGGATYRLWPFAQGLR